MVKIAELYTEVTNKLIEELEKGVKPWQAAWRGSAAKNGLSVMPSNLASGRHYSGINTLILWHASMSRGYPTHQWLTFQQAQSIGARVQQGEKATPVIFTKWQEETKDGQTISVPIVRRFYVFNKAQLEGVASGYEQLAQSPDLATAAAVVKDSGVTVKHGYTKAYYDRTIDEVHLPDWHAFPDGPAYCRTAFHELVHASGHKSRLNREFGKRFGDAEYAHEEIVAELGAAFLCAKTGITYHNENAEYIGAWLGAMKKDPRYIFKAASHASQASDWLYGKTQELLPHPEHTQELEAAL